jgi:hypothetical protein
VVSLWRVRGPTGQVENKQPSIPRFLTLAPNLRALVQAPLVHDPLIHHPLIHGPLIHGPLIHGPMARVTAPPARGRSATGSGVVDSCWHSASWCW